MLSKLKMTKWAYMEVLTVRFIITDTLKTLIFVLWCNDTCLFLLVYRILPIFHCAKRCGKSKLPFTCCSFSHSMKWYTVLIYRVLHMFWQSQNICCNQLRFWHFLVVLSEAERQLCQFVYFTDNCKVSVLELLIL